MTKGKINLSKWKNRSQWYALTWFSSSWLCSSQNSTTLCFMTKRTYSAISTSTWMAFCLRKISIGSPRCTKLITSLWLNYTLLKRKKMTWRQHKRPRQKSVEGILIKNNPWKMLFRRRSHTSLKLWNAVPKQSETCMRITKVLQFVTKSNSCYRSIVPLPFSSGHWPSCMTWIVRG